jgi:hypothetical protein
LPEPKKTTGAPAAPAAINSTKNDCAEVWKYWTHAGEIMRRLEWLTEPEIRTVFHELRRFWREKQQQPNDLAFYRLVAVYLSGRDRQAHGERISNRVGYVLEIVKNGYAPSDSHTRQARSQFESIERESQDPETRSRLDQLASELAKSWKIETA